MCQAVSVGALSPDQACQRLFGPALLSRLEQMNALPSLRNAIHMATELEDVAALLPDKLSGALADIEAELRAALTVLVRQKPTGSKWLVRDP